MGDVIKLRGHARASKEERDASLAKISVVKPAARAVPVPKIGSHHSGGMLSRCDHLRTADELMPTSAPKASEVFQRATTSRKLETMSSILGPSVPKVKAAMSHDIRHCAGHAVLMDEDDEEHAEIAWREAFRDRIRLIQGSRSQEDMADLLGISRDQYSKYVGNRLTQMPTRLLPKLAKIGAMTLEELIEGPKNKPLPKAKPVQKRRAS